MALGSESTTFTLDNMGRFLCNTLQEALDSTGQPVVGGLRGFDVIVIGGGTFGSVMAEALFMRDGSRSRRILILEAGPFVLPEHVQNMPFQGGTPDFRRPWVYDPVLQPVYQFPGLMYAIGGRSLAWGGWSPELLHDTKNDEMTNWPASVVTDLPSIYFPAASDEIGVTATNDFIHGPLHDALRRQLLPAFAAAGSRPAGLILDDLPHHPIVRDYLRTHPGKTVTEIPDSQLRDWLDLLPSDPTPRDDMFRLLKLEAPLAVQSVTEPGLFPFNKFSALPLLIQAARTASKEADGVGAAADARKRITVVPDCHVQELITQTQNDNWVRVVGVRAVDRSGAAVDIPLIPPGAGGGQGVVVIALGTIESTRLALTTFQNSLAGRAAQRMGENLLAHLRSNLNIRIPKESLITALSPSDIKTLQVSALFVKGKATISGKDRYFHLQITASGLTDLGNDSEANLFKKVPDIDQVKGMTEADKTSVVITLRGIGEMTPMNPDSRVGLAQTPGDVDFGRPAAYVTLGNALKPVGGSPQTQDDANLWDAMDSFADAVAMIFANGKPFEVLIKNRAALVAKVVEVPAGATAADLKAIRQANTNAQANDLRDPLGTTHHEAGTLRMSDLPANGVTNDFGRIHDTTNCYVAAPAIFPTTGSPNPMLTGVALARRTADLLTKSVLPKPLPFVPDTAGGYKALFDGTGVSFNRWTRVSPGGSNGFALVNGEIITYGTSDFGLFYYAAEAFADFTLRLQFRVVNARGEIFGDGTKVQNSGVFIRFRDPLLDPTPLILARMINEKNDFQLFQQNRAWSAVHSGFEVQIDDNAMGDGRKDFYSIRPEPNGLRKNRTGALYKIPAKDPIPNSGQFDAELQVYNPAPDLIPGVWYEYEIDVRGNKYTVDLTNTGTGAKVRTATFTNSDPNRGVAQEGGQPIGYIGLQSYSNSPVAFRHIQIKV